MKRSTNHNHHRNDTTSLTAELWRDLFGIEFYELGTVLFISGLLAVLASLAIYMFAVYCI